MGSQGAVDVVEMFLAFDIYRHGDALIIAAAAIAYSHVAVFGIRGVLLHGFQHFGGKVGVLVTHKINRKIARKFDEALFFFSHFWFLAGFQTACK